MKVEKIQKKGSKYKIILNDGNEITTSGEVILKNNLLYNKEIDEKLLEKISNDTVYYQAYNKIVKKISARWRSECEVRKFLKENGVSENDIDEMVESLTKIGLIDDERFMKAFINDKFNLTMDGPYKIIRELQKHNIDTATAYSIIDTFPKELIDERIDKILMKKVKNNKQFSTYVLTQKIISYLTNLGYERADIDRHLYKIETDKVLMEKEMDKVARSISNKHVGEAFIKKLKEKLYRRGYKIEDINEYIDKKYK